MKKLFILAFLVMLIAPFAGLAAINPCVAGPTTNDSSIGECVNQVYLWSIGVAGILALGMIVVGGYLIVMSRGNAEQVSKGKSFIYSSLIGLALLLGAFLILYTINPDLTNLEINTACLDAPVRTGSTTAPVPSTSGTPCP